MTAKTFTKFDLKPIVSNSDQWVTLVPDRTSSLSLFGSHIKTLNTTPKPSLISLKDGGTTFVQEVQPLKRLRSTRPSKRLQKLRSKAYRVSYTESATGNHIATQIRLMREAAGLTQADFAKKLRTRQSAVARLEDPSYGKQSLAMLHRIAQIFDVVTWVEFTPYSKFLQRTADLSGIALTPLPYSQEFDEDGEPMTSVDLRFDGSVICMTNYASRQTLMVQTNFGSPTIAHTVGAISTHD